MKRAAVLAALLLASCGGQSSPQIAVSDAWARATTPGKTASAAYLTIANRGGGDDALVGVTSTAGSATLHSTSTDTGIMRMRPVERLPIAAGETVKLRPGSTHLMLTGLAGPLTPGGTIELSLQFEKSGERTVSAVVRPASGVTK